MEIHGDCPNCKNRVAIDVDKLEVKSPQVQVKQLENPSTIAHSAQVQVQEIKPIEPQIKIKAVAPRDQPFFRCKDCDDKHPNPNYKIRPNKRCPNCGSLNGEKACKTCNKKTHEDDWEELDEDTLDELEIPNPKQEPHNHSHEDD